MTQSLIYGWHLATVTESQGEYRWADGPSFIGWVHQHHVTEPTQMEIARFEKWWQQVTERGRKVA